MINVKGKLVDNETRCEHYNSAVDIIAIKFKCCNEYYPCYQCHQEEANHDTKKWLKEDFNKKAILCGICKHELTIQAYFDSGNNCPVCKSSFNPNCSLHYHLYFGV